MSKGITFNIEEFAVHDGPGIRKLVFFKGCPLRCAWCHNPEGISFNKELMVSHNGCINCDRCFEVCPRKEHFNKVTRFNIKCIACGNCVEVCPVRLRWISGQKFEAGELADKLLKGKEVLINSGGGITISGGEPLAQPDFLFDLIRKLKPLEIAVETSGYANINLFQRLVSVADLILMDVKHTDPAIHKKYTGVDNSIILENLHYLCLSDTPFYIRIPLIPGVNDTKSNMKNTALLIKDAKNLQRVELLPYHKTAGAKYPMIGLKYNPMFDTNQKVNIHKEIFEQYNINVTVL
jgi:pyruvate formate lyase activating enzyme